MMSRTQAAALLSVSVDTFDRHVRPHLPNHSDNSRPLFKEEEIDSWVQTQRVPPRNGMH
jgi:hypothetical protein